MNKNLIQKIMENEKLIISKNISDCYLIYTGVEYYFINPKNNSYNITKIAIKDNPSDVEETLTFKEMYSISDNVNYNGSLILIKTHLEYCNLTEKQQEQIIQNLFYDLAEVYYYNKTKETTEDFDKITRFKAITDEIIIDKINEIVNQSTNEDIIKTREYIEKSFSKRIEIKYATRVLGDYLNKTHNIILRRNTHDIYKLDIENNGYNATTIDEIIIDLSKYFEKNIFSTNDVENAITYISDRLTPNYNIIKFKNCLYSMKEHDIIEPKEPVFTLVECPYNYNPNAEPEYVKEFLYTSLEQKTEEKTEEYVNGVFEAIGYLFTSGNSRNILCWLIGIGGGGKSTFANIIQAIFHNKCSDLDFSEIEKSTHITSILVNNHLNIVREAKAVTVYDNKPYKVLAGNDPIPINPKGKNPYMLPKEEVPKSIMVANNMPRFNNPVIAILQRFLIIEFKKSFRNTENQIKNLDDKIIESESDMEWLIYKSLEAYKKMVVNDGKFKLQLTEEETKDLIFKHSKPLHYLISKLIKHDKEALRDEIKLTTDGANGQTNFTTPYIINTELNDVMVYLAKKEGIEIAYSGNTNRINGKTLTKAIKDVFELQDYKIKTEEDSFINYTTIPKRIGKGVVRIYPEMCKLTYYKDMLEQMKAEEEKNNI